MLQASVYHNTAIADWEVHTCAGDNHDAYDACAQARTALIATESGWIGRIGEEIGKLSDIGQRCAHSLWSRYGHSEAMPICCISSSKGMLDHYLENDCRFHQIWPSALASEICQSLGIATYIGNSSAAACSTGLYTLLDAADLFEQGHASCALTGAADASLTDCLLAAYKNLGVMAQRQPQVFMESDQATGFAPAEGAAFFRFAQQGAWQLRAAVRAGDASHITRCEDAALIQSCFDALWQHVPEPDLIVSHATGTAWGDQFEQAALQHGPWSKTPLLHCKPSIGHCLGASGSVELAIGLHSPNTVQRLWKISLGFGGHIAAVALTRN